MSKNLILGLAEGYPVAQIAPFVVSLRRTGYTGDVVFFVRNISMELREFLTGHQVKLINYRRLDTPGIRFIREFFLKFIRTYMRLTGREMPFTAFIVQRVWHCMAARFYLYRCYLNRIECAHYDCVMITDVRDVVFQRDPFEGMPDGEFLAFEEHSSLRLADQRENALWIKSMFGEAVLNDLGNHPVICAGVSMGTLSGMKRYLAEMTQILALHHEPFGYDQGVHNFILRKSRVDGAQIFPFGKGIVMHLATAPQAAVIYDSEDNILNSDARPCNTIHQYDRHARINAKVVQQFSRS